MRYTLPRSFQAFFAALSAQLRQALLLTLALQPSDDCPLPASEESPKALGVLCLPCPVINGKRDCCQTTSPQILCLQAGETWRYDPCSEALQGIWLSWHFLPHLASSTPSPFLVGALPHKSLFLNPWFMICVWGNPI